jgi:hypothetical protein
VRQNDADSETVPFLCGAAAAQMILYGRDDGRFASAASTQLAVPAAVRREDQDAIWQAMIAESEACPLPSGVHYDGSPQQDQICEGDAFCWATFPRALARLLDHGVALASGDLTAFNATARAVSSEFAIEDAIVDSLDRGVGVALLVDGVHWVVVYRFDELDDGDVSVYYRDGLLPKVQSNAPIGISTFESELSALSAGVFDGKYVAVTASSSMPVIAQPEMVAPRPPRRRRRRRRPVPPPDRLPVVLPDGLARELPRIVARDPEWDIAFRDAQTRAVLPVRLASGRGPGYYAVDCVTARGGRSVRTGSVVVDASTHRPILIAGIEEPDQELPPLLSPGEAPQALDALVRKALGGATAQAAERECDDVGQVGDPPEPLFGLDPASLRIEAELTWRMCDQSTSPFLPFYVVKGRHARTGAEKTIHMRADGRWLGEITRSLAGI